MNSPIPDPMLYNYIKIALRNLLKNKLFSAINIVGMAISLAIVLVIALFLNDELKYDTHIAGGDKKYRIYNHRITHDGTVSKLPIVPYPFATYLQKDFPEIKRAVRVMDTYGEVLFEINNVKVNEKGGFYTESDFFDMLDIEVIEGMKTEALDRPNTVALSKTIAEKYFKEKNPIGQTIKISKADFEVTAVYNDMDARTHLRPTFLLSLETYAVNWGPRKENWVWQQFFTYLEFNEPINVEDFEQKLSAFVQKYAYPKIEPEGFKYIPHLQSLQDIHLYSSDFEWEAADRGNNQTVVILGVTGVLILIISCLNFVNLSTARSIKRMKEVGVRKVVGAYRTQLIFQFITESVMITIAGLLIAISLMEMILPYLNSFTEKQIADPLNQYTIPGLIGFAILLGVAAGSYPALHISGLRPVLIFRNKEGRSSAEFFRKSLVVLQFAFSFLLIISAMVVIGQYDLLKNKDLGFKKDQLLIMPMHDAHTKNIESTKQQFLAIPNVAQASLSFGIPGDIIAGDGVIDPSTNKNLPANLFLIDTDYIPTYEMQMVAGRNFSKVRPADSLNFILNETALRNYGLGTPEEAIGKPLQWNKWGGALMKGEIIGVVRDFNFRTLKDKVEPAVMVMMLPQGFGSLTVRLESSNASGTISELKKVYESIAPDWPFEYKFVDQNFEAMYKNEQKLSSMLSLFTGFAIFVACLGLFGLVEFSVNQRAKEISIRKVFGAGIPSLLLLLTKKYFTLIMIAFLIVLPLSYYIADEWLQNFAYRIELRPGIFIKSGLLIIIITVLTVSFQSLRAALTNPAHVLKNE